MADINSLPPQPPIDGPLVDQSPPTHAWKIYLTQLDVLLRAFIGAFNSLSQGALTTAADQTLLAGFAETEIDLGTGSGSVSPSALVSLKQKVTNNGAFTISPAAVVGDVELRIVNGASAGAITVSGFTKQWIGDSLDTVNGHQFMMFIYVYGGSVSSCIIKALQ